MLIRVFPTAVRTALVVPVIAIVVSCGDDDNDGLTEADRYGVGAQCRTNADCYNPPDAGIVTICLTQFKGGYCGVQNCTGPLDCPERSACVAHEDGTNYCFRICADKPECNFNRTKDNESNCSGSITWVGPNSGKACVPPSSGI